MIEHSTFWLLYGQYGATVSVEQFAREFCPRLALRTVRNKISAGELPRPINGVRTW